MWILGLLVTYGLYRFLVVWYLSLWLRSRGQRAYYWDSAWYHIAVLAVVALLLALSMFLFSRTDGWLALLPLRIIPTSIYLRRRKSGQKLAETIRTAVALEYRLAGEGKSRSAINRQIVEHFLGSAPSEGWALADDDLRTVLKCYILPELGLYQIDQDLALMNKPGAVMIGTQIDALIDSWGNASTKSKA